jgi:2-iminoacetate synthase
MENFSDFIKLYSWEAENSSIASKTPKDVKRALSKGGKGSLEDFKALISSSAAPFLEEMAHLSQKLTLEQFGNTIQLYIPLYLSNECQNTCSYCGFNRDNKIERLTLNEEQILAEIKVIKSWGYDHILLVTGESKQKVGMAYFVQVLKLIKPFFSHISMEVQPLEQDEYEQLIALGLNSVMIYQETYDSESYKRLHTGGRKSHFKNRLDTPDKIGRAGMYKIGLGTLIGLIDNWRTDTFFTALHLTYLERKYWQTKYSISFPRLRAAKGLDKEPDSVMSDRELVQLICAYRIFNRNVELSLSTRESPLFRDNVMKLGITSVSAGSKTDPGGYAMKADSLEQFEISDDRSPADIEKIIQNQGYDAVWKDWDDCLGPR